MGFEYLKYLSDGLDKNALLDELMITYGKDVWNYAFFITRRKELAEDIAQDVFVKVYEHLHSFRGDTGIKTWLLSITRNTALDCLKTAWMRKVQLFPARLRDGSQPSAESEWFRLQERRDVWRTVLNLPRKQREVLLLFAHHRLSIKEIAHVLQVSEGTVKSRLHRARREVNRLMADGEARDGGERT